MSRRQLLLFLVLTAVMATSVQFTFAPFHAIDKATPTPAVTEIPEDLDIDQAVENLLTLLEEEAFDEAQELAGRILLEDAEAWRAYYYRGFAHVQLKDLEAGIEDYTAVLNMRPWDSAFWRLRGDLHLKDRNPRQARSDYKQALFTNPRSLQSYQSLASLHERDVDKKLRDLYQTIVEAGQANSRGASNRALDRLTEAIVGSDRGNIPAELGYAYFMRANIWEGEQHWEYALADLTAALEMQPEMQDYYLARGIIYAETGQQVLAGHDFYRRMTLLERESLDAARDSTQSVTVDMAYGLVARLRFDGEAEQRVTIAARDNVGAGVDPLLALLNGELVPLAGDDDGGGKRDALIGDYVLPADGTYIVVIGHANGGHEGKIRVSLRFQGEEATG